MSGELIEVNDTAPAVSNTFEMVDVESAKAFMDNYQDVVEALLDSSDYQKMGKNRFKKKSAWRKLATAFNISDEIVNEEIVTDENNQIISAKYYVKATLPNGRSCVGIGSCSIFDKITKKDATQPSNFVLRNRFNNAEHDVPSTAHTRAKSRAVSDLIGAGEVSAEEMSENTSHKKPVSVKPKPKVVKPKPAAKPKAEPVKSDKKDEAIEVEVVKEEGKKTSSKTIKDMMDENKAIKRVVDDLNIEHRTINRYAIEDRLKTWLNAGALTEEEYKEALSVME